MTLHKVPIEAIFYDITFCQRHALFSELRIANCE